MTTHHRPTPPIPEPAHTYRYPPVGAHVALAFVEAEVPEYLHANRRRAAVALLDDAVAVFTRAGRFGEKAPASGSAGEAWRLGRDAEHHVVCRLAHDGRFKWYGRRQGHSVGELDVRFHPRFDAASGSLLGSTLVDGDGRALRDHNVLGNPPHTVSPLEELATAVMAVLGR